jgi:hypothetical protein
MATPSGIKKQAARVLIPDKSVTVADPPRISIEETIMFVAKPKNMKIKWATVPHRAPMISSQVWAYGAFNLSLAASCAKRRTWIVAPEPYHQGPEIPNLYATALDCSYEGIRQY